MAVLCPPTGPSSVYNAHNPLNQQQQHQHQQQQQQQVGVGFEIPSKTSSSV
jgi:hypothetical protein